MLNSVLIFLESKTQLILKIKSNDFASEIYADANIQSLVYSLVVDFLKPILEH